MITNNQTIKVENMAVDNIINQFQLRQSVHDVVVDLSDKNILLIHKRISSALIILLDLQWFLF
ncbi:unnamed protein product [marine sediment metagenome]|uniref:Uncharacterized protein n=1 Tax=marine sediment metagenome TaxID=412755 RepID=X0Z6U4_9ZZZZ